MSPTSQLPIVDLSPFFEEPPSQANKLKTAKSLYDACVNHGFFYLTGHNIPEATRQNILSIAKDWFLTTPQDDKNKLKRRDPGDGDGDGVRGYQRLGENVTKGRKDEHEAIDLYRPWITPSQPPHKLLQGPNQWPSDSYKKVFDSYLSEVLNLGAVLMRCMALSLSLPEDYFEPYTDSSFWVMRIIGYPPLKSEAEGDSCGEHTDYGCWTLLLTDETKGALQVQAKDGSWIPADPIPGAYVVNIGDMGSQWTNGLFKSTVHKVIHKAKNYRVSVPFFFEPNFDAKIAPLDICLEKTGGKPKFGEVVYGNHLISKVSSNFG